MVYFLFSFKSINYMKKTVQQLLVAIITITISLFCYNNGIAQTGDNCSSAIVLNGDTTITNSGINITSGSAIGGTGTNSLWYVFTPPTGGTISVNSCLGGTDTQLSIHDLGISGSCTLASTIPTAGNDDACEFSPGSSSYASEINGLNVTGGNTYAIEWSDRWSSAAFTWNLIYDPLIVVLGCTDPCDSNYDAAANTNDPTACAGDDVCGCTDSLAVNYDPTAIIDDGSCGFPGDNCLTALDITSCDTTITNNGIPINGSSIATAGTNALWYTFVAPGTGLVNINSCLGGVDTEVAIHDLGALADCSVISSTALAESDDACAVTAGGSNFASEITGQSVIGGNTYAIEWGDRWSADAFTWNFSFDCGAVNVTNIITNTVAAQIDFVDTLADGSTLSPDIEYGLAGFTAGTGTTITGATNPIILTGLNSGVSYDYCITYPCGTTGCNALSSCGTFTTEASCVFPEVTINTDCIAPGFFDLNIEITNQFAFSGGIMPGNSSGFDILLNSGFGFFDSNIDVISTASLNIPGPFSSGTPITVQLVGIDDIGCPVTTLPLDENCNLGSSCGYAYTISGCDSTIVANGIDINGTSIATDGTDALWYLFTPPSNGILQISSENDPNGTNTEVAVHNLGIAGDCALAANPATAEDDDSGLGSTSFVNLNLIGGNTYAIEWGNQWSSDTFTWDFNFGCEAISNVNFIGATESAAQIDFTDTLSDGTSIIADIEFGPTGMATTTVTANANPIILTGLNSGTTYDYCVTYPCASGCSSLPVCGSFTTEVTCTAPLYTLTPVCIANGFFSIDVTVTNLAAFTGGLFPGNASGFDINIDVGSGFIDSNLDIVAENVPVSLNGPFTSGTAISVLLSGIDDQGCPSIVQTTDIDCSCFGVEPTNDICLDAISLVVDPDVCSNILTSNNNCASDSGETPPTCASYSGGDIWFTVVVPASGEISIETSLIAGGFADSGMSIYNGTCGALTEIECDDDGSASGAFSLISLTGQTPSDVLFVRVWEFGNNLEGEFGICAWDPSPIDVCPQTLQISGLVATGTYNADDVITSDGQINASSGGNVNYNAGANVGEFIELSIGFEADGAVNFTAENIECNPLD